MFCDLVFASLPFYPQLGQEAYAGKFDLSLGGSAPHVSVGLSRLGLKVALVSLVGTDFLGQWALAQLRESGIETKLVRTSATEKTNLTVAISYGVERAFVTYLADDPSLLLEELDWDTLASARLLHVAGFYGFERQQSLFEKARSFGLMLSWDVGWMAVREHASDIRHLLPLVDIFLPNEAEIKALTDEGNIEAALAKIANQKTLTVVKLGEKGALAFNTKMRQIIHQPGIPVEVIDTTGAGDAFAAGFIFGYLMNRPVETCLLYGNICGALSTTRLGGTAGLPRKEELLRLAEHLQTTK